MSGTPEPIRVLRVIARLNVGGPSLHVSYLASELDKRGYETRLVAGVVGAGEGSMAYVAESLGVKPLMVDSLQRELSFSGDLAAIFEIRRLIRHWRPDVVHTHTAKAGAVARIAALLSGSARPQILVHTFHGHVLRGYFGDRATEVFRRVERTLGRRTDALIAVSKEVRDDLVRLGVAPASKFQVIRLGLDLEGRTKAEPGSRETLRGELRIAESTFLVAWLGRLTEIKRPDLLIAAFSNLIDAGADAELALVGEGTLRESVQRDVERRGLADRVHFLGYRSDVASVYAASDAVVLTSANEGTPVSLIEALAAERPVVSTDVGGARDVVREGESGFLVEFGDAVGLAERLGRLAADPDLRRRMGEAGRRDVENRYSVRRLVEDVDQLYRTLLAQPSLKRAGRLTPTLTAAAHRAAQTRPASPRTLRVVLVSQYFSPEIGATQLRMQSFAEYLAARGHQVTVICEQPNHPHGVIPDSYRGVLVDDDRSNDYRVLRVWVKASRAKTPRTRMAFYLSFMGMAAAVAPKAGRADVVFATSPPLFTAVAGLTIARMNRAPLVLDVRDLWPAAAVSLNQIDEGLQLQLAEWLEAQLYRKAEVVTAVTQPFCEHIDAIRDGGPRSVLLPNGTLDMFFQDGSPERLAAPDEFLVTFAGTHGIAQALPSVLDAAERIGPAARFAFVGDGPVKPLLTEAARSRKIANVDFHAQRPSVDMPGLLRGSDALLVPLSAHPTFADFVPSKLIDFMAIGRPIVLSANGEAARILESAGAGVAVPPEDPEALAGAIRWLAEHPGEASEMGERGREFARKRLRSSQAQRLEELLLHVTSRRR